MARYFNAMADCGAEEAVAREIAAAFQGFEIVVAPGLATICRTHCEVSEQGTWRAMIQPDQAWTGSSRTELLDHEDAMASAIYEKLRTCRGFLVAFVGHETQEIIAKLDEPGWYVTPGFVVRADSRHLLSPKHEVEEFSPGYVWAPPPQLRARHR